MIARLVSVARKMQQAKTVSGKSLAAQMREIRALRSGPERIGVDEYFELRLYAKSREEQRDFLGAWWEGALNYMTDSPFWFATVRDKILFHNIFTAFGYPTAPISFCFTRSGRRALGADSIDTAEALAARLRAASYPLYAKPAGSDVGIGGFLIAGHDREHDTLDLVNRGATGVEDFSASVTGTVYGGYLFQPLLTNSAAMAVWAGQRLCTLRLCVIKSREEAWIHRAFLKLRCGDNHNDNWSHGEHGNALVTIDESTGKMIEVIGGTVSNPVHSSVHPDSGIVLAGRRIDGFSDACDLVLAASAEIPGMSILHWDVALTDNGPLLLEANEDGSLAALQGCGRRGFLDERFRRFMRDFGHDFTSAVTQSYARDIAAIVQRLYGVDNALMGRGSLYAPQVRME